MLRKDIGTPMLRPWAILVTTLCPNYQHLVLRGDMVAIRVEEEDYLASLEDCKTHLHGRISL